MALFEQFPYTNFHGVNLDWILSTIRDNESGIATLNGKIGNLSDLDTDEKSSLVAAINDTLSQYASSSYNSLTNKPSINGVTLAGDKTTSDLGIAYSDLSGLPLTAYSLVIPGNGSATISITSGRSCLLFIGGLMVSFMQSYASGSSYNYNEIALSSAATNISLNGAPSIHQWTITNGGASNFSAKIYILQGSASVS